MLLSYCVIFLTCDRYEKNPLRTGGERKNQDQSSSLSSLSTAVNASLGQGDAAQLAHLLFALFLLFQQLFLAGDVAAVALGQHVLAHGLDRLTGDDLAADGRLNGDLEEVARDVVPQLLADAAALGVGVVAEDDHGQSIHGVAVEQEIQLHQVALAVLLELVVVAGVAAAPALDGVEEVVDDLAQRYLVMQVHARFIHILHVNEHAALGLAEVMYAERLVFDGEGDAVEAMNQTMQELQASVLSAARTDSMNLDTEMSIDTAESDGSEEETLPQEADAAQPVYSMALTIDGDDAITYLDDHYVCVRADGYEYTGGAHGTPFRQYFVFDRETGARLSLSDVVENPVEELQAKVGAAFRELAERQFCLESPEDLEHTVADGISYESPFYLSETGVVFYYAPYEIASYAEGFPEVTIPYSELEMRIELSK